MKYKYAKIVCDVTEAGIWNYGDYVQTIAIENIYRRMGISESNIEVIQKSELSSYASGGEKLILPMQGHFPYSGKEDIFPLSKDITPVFIGFSRCENSDLKEYYKDAGIIGCRDESTYRNLRNKNINAFISGCLTVCLPRRMNVPKNGKVFLVDQPKEIENYMPNELRDKIVYISHETSDGMNLMERTRNLLDMYRDEAELIVTSRLHCASPCMAMGIPVVLARQYFDSRYEWIGKYLPLYTPDNFKSIDWYPDAVDIEETKEQIIELASRMIRLENVTEESRKIHDFYMSRKKEKISMPLKTKLFMKTLKFSPKLAYFIRNKLLRRYTVLNDKKY